MEDYLFVDSQEALSEAAAVWRSCPELGVDIECENNLHYYGTYISIIQVSSKDTNWIVDVLALNDLSPLTDVFSDPGVVKIFHDVSFDFRILNYQLGCIPCNVFDTQVAAVFSGFTELGLGSLLESFFSVKKEKRFQRANWVRRPIPPDMLSYAVGDTHYLISLKALLLARLEELGRASWVAEEMGVLEGRDYILTIPSFSDFPGYSNLSDSQRGILKELYSLREGFARKLNRPPYFIMNRKRINDILAHPPRSLREWRELKGVHPVVKNKASLFFEAVESGRKNPVPFKREPKKRFPPEKLPVLEKLSLTRDLVAEEVGLQKSLVMSKDQMQEVAASGCLDCLRTWQRTLFDGRL